MPTISLRMTDDQLEELREWARQGNRSMQREIIWRLFSAEAVGAPKYAPAVKGVREPIEVPADGTMSPPVSADAQPRDIPSRTITGATIQDRQNVDAEWLKKRAARK